MYIQTTALHKILKMRNRIRVVQGGARAGKSIAILLILIDIAQSHDKKTISVISETIPHLKRGVMRDFLSILKEQNYYSEKNWNRSDFIYTFHTGSIIEFFSADSPDKVRGPARDIMFINECNNVSYDIYTQLTIRTSEYIYLDYNPVAEFWVHENVLTRKDHTFIILTYKDNEALPQTIVDEIESRKGNRNFWTVFGLGLIGEAEGKIFTGWNIIDDMPHEARLERRGLDFGFSHDPAALVAIYKHNGGFILDEELYQLNMHNKPLADFILNLEYPHTTVYADSASPQNIDEIHMYGVNIRPSNKGAGSIRQGIDYMQDQRFSVTKRSVNIIKEYRNYMWERDKDGVILKKPVDLFNHAMDAIRYALETYSRNAGVNTGIVTVTPQSEELQSYVADESGAMPGYSPIKALQNQDKEDWYA